MALLKAVQFARDFGISHFVIEGDAVNVINKFNRKEDDLSIIGHIIAGVKIMLPEFPSVQIVIPIGKTMNQHI